MSSTATAPWLGPAAVPILAPALKARARARGRRRAAALLGVRRSVVLRTATDRRSDGCMAAAGDKNVGIMGGADVIRLAFAAGQVDELAVAIAPVILGSGKRLFEGFDATVGLEHVDVRQSRWVTHLRYRMLR
ncbi:MAG TPA: dihydrofolate reductase family protein [Jiangellaceae bacterium]|nr:dihydrofolate reductase family protein [Jiangellaceae bacterium]